MSDPVDRFGELLITQLRDSSIRFFDAACINHWKAPELQQLQADLSSLAPEQQEVARRALVAAIDHGIHGFLFALVEAHDQGKEVVITVNDEDVLDLSDGLHGEPWGDDGWIARFSQIGLEAT